MLTLRIEPGRYADYTALARFHYLPRRPATVALVLRATARLRSGREDLAGVAVLSYPVPRCAERHTVFPTGHQGLAHNLAWANAHLRTLSRLIVHPRYRGLGLATALTRAALRHCPTPYLEARSQLAHALPLFEHAGMTKAPTLSPHRPAYYWGPTGRTNPKLEIRNPKEPDPDPNQKPNP